MWIEEIEILRMLKSMRMAQLKQRSLKLQGVELDDRKDLRKQPHEGTEMDVYRSYDGFASGS